MSSARMAGEGRLTSDPTGAAAPVWWAMVLFLLVEAVAFGAFISSYFYLQFRSAVWPPEGTALPEPLLAGIAGLLLLASSGAYLWASRGIRKGDAGRLRLGLGLALLLAIGFLVLLGVERARVDYRWDTHAYGSIVWATLLLHALHVLVLVLIGALLLALARKGYFTRARHHGVRLIGLLWHFVALLWIPLFALLYLSPYGR